MTLSPSQVDRIAARVVELLDGRPDRPWGDVKAVARELGVQEWWVYENARRLGGVKLGPGRSARWRFDMGRLRELVGSGALEELPDADPASRAADPPNSRPARRPQARPAPARPPDEGFDDSPVPMARLDCTGRFIAINPAFSSLIGYTEAEFIRARWPSPHDRDDFEDQKRLLEELVAGRIEELEFRSSYLHGQGLVVQLAGRIGVDGDQGDAVRLLLVVAT